MTRTVRLGAAARQRIRAGGVLSKGRASLSLIEWNALKARVFKRAGRRCEHCKRKAPLEAHHVKKRSAGGADDERNLVALCGGPKGCHARTDFPLAKGRLVIEPIGEAYFLFRVVTKPSKWAKEELDAK